MNGKLDLRIQKTYMALSNALMILMQEKSFEEITVNELCARALVGRGTFYKHFADKYEFLSFCVREPYRNFQKEISSSANSTSSFEARICILLDTSFCFIEQSPVLIAVLKSVQGNSSIEKAISGVVVPDFVKQFREMQANGYALPFDAVPMAELAVAVTSQTIMWWVKNRETVPKEVFLPFLYKNISSLLAPLMKICRFMQMVTSFEIICGVSKSFSTNRHPVKGVPVAIPP